MRLAKRQTGVALVMAITIVSLAAITATAITVINQRQIIRTSNIILRDQAFQFAVSAEFFAMRVLNEDGADNNSDHLDEAWYNEGQEQVLPIDFAGIQDSSRFYLTGKVIDLQSRLSVNAINTFPSNGTTPGNTGTLSTLLSTLDISVESTAVLQSSLTDWIDSNDDSVNSNGAEQYYYLGLEQPYQAANTALLHTSTLRQVRGFDEIEEDDFILLQQELNALPQDTKLNINTASDNILDSIGLNENTIATISSNKPYDDVASFLTDANTQTGITFSADNFTVESEYFLLAVTAVMDKARVRINSIIQRNNTSNTSKVILRIIGDY